MAGNRCGRFGLFGKDGSTGGMKYNTEKTRNICEKLLYKKGGDAAAFRRYKFVINCCYKFHVLSVSMLQTMDMI